MCEQRILAGDSHITGAHHLEMAAIAIAVNLGYGHLVTCEYFLQDTPTPPPLIHSPVPPPLRRTLLFSEATPRANRIDIISRPKGAPRPLHDHYRHVIIPVGLV